MDDEISTRLEGAIEEFFNVSAADIRGVLIVVHTDAGVLMLHPYKTSDDFREALHMLAHSPLLPYSGGGN